MALGFARDIISFVTWKGLKERVFSWRSKKKERKKSQIIKMNVNFWIRFFKSISGIP